MWSPLLPPFYIVTFNFDRLQLGVLTECSALQVWLVSSFDLECVPLVLVPLVNWKLDLKA